MSAPITKADLYEALAPLAPLPGQVGQIQRDLSTLEGKVSRLQDGMERLKDEVTGLRRDTALGFDQTNTARERADDALNAKIDRRYSDTISHMDTFMAQTLAVRTDEKFLIHRVDKLEDRVDGLEGK